MSTEQEMIPGTEQFLIGLDCPIKDFVRWENIFRENLPLPTDKDDLERFDEAIDRFYSLVKRAKVGEEKLKRLVEIDKGKRDEDRDLYSLSEVEGQAVDAIQLLLQYDLTPRLAGLQRGLEAYWSGQSAEPNDRHLIFFTINRLKIKAMVGDRLIKTVPVETPVS